MYENQTYEAILRRMLGRVPQQIDKREGSIIYDALAPAAAELAQMYMELDVNNNLSFADTATGEYLERRTLEFGIEREPATKARRKGLFFASGQAPMDVPTGSRFSIRDLDYTAISKIKTGEWIIECETAGTAGNQEFGTLLPIEYIDGLARAELGEVLVPGEDAESDEALRQRYLEVVNEQPFGGNVADYKQKISAMDGVGGVKIFPVWNGGGTVKVTMISSQYTSPSQELIEEVQTILDPEKNHGEGIGLAPIGHTVTVAGAEGVVIDVTATLTLANDTTIGQVQTDVEDALQSYFGQLRQNWAHESALAVRVAQIDARILTVAGVVDVSHTLLNGQAGNIQLTEEQIPLLGKVTLDE